MKHLRNLCILAAACLAFGLATPARAIDTSEPAVAAFITKMVQDHHFDRKALTGLLAETPFDPDVIERMESPAEALPWSRYRAIFVTPERIAAGSAFVSEHRQTLAAAKKKYGVPASVIAAIIGIESHFGRYKGDFSALSALATLAFDYPRRADFFRRELAKYLLLCRKNGFDPRALESSYAGALGAGQFIPSSYLAYAVDADGDGSDMFSSWPDIVSSVANYLAVHGWKAGKPVVARAQLEPSADPDHLAGRELPARELRTAGIAFGADVAGNTSVRLVEVEVQEGGSEETQYWVGLPNFLVIMRYNHSPLYALAASQLAAAIARASASDEAALAARQR
ncbi:MAG: lytic murein transglycosylase B [Gammaproteobacteria bacterium]|nr:lytic murein transglycosylase B [Gammaproteobacteria bacterium]